MKCTFPQVLAFEVFSLSFHYWHFDQFYKIPFLLLLCECWYLVHSILYTVYMASAPKHNQYSDSSYRKQTGLMNRDPCLFFLGKVDQNQCVTF